MHRKGVVTPLSSHSQFSENGDVAHSPWKAEGPFSEDWGFHYSYPQVKNGEWRKLLVRRFYRKAYVFHLIDVYTKLLLHFIRVKHTKVIWACEQSINSYHKLTRVIPILHSPRATIGVSHLSPWRSYHVGSSISSSSILYSPILHSPRRCDNP